MCFCQGLSKEENKPMSSIKTVGKIAFSMMLLFLSGAGAQAEEASKQALFDELFTVMKYDRIIDQMSEGIDAQLVTALRRKYPQIDDRTLAAVTEVLHESFEDLIPEMKAFTRSFMMKHFNEDDIRNITAFYRTPAGRKSLTVLPNMGKELNTWLVPVIQKMKGGLLAKLNKRLKRDGYEL